MRNNFNQKYGDVAKYALLKVLETDSKNISANINLGILYYNQGATLMRMMDYDVDLAQLDVIQENAKKLFKQSLPFMIKVYELDPKAEKAIESLQGIYSALLDDEKANEFKQKKEALNKK
jgi:lipopolysaccharide biosynthesis regulator YciM